MTTKKGKDITLLSFSPILSKLFFGERLNVYTPCGPRTYRHIIHNYEHEPFVCWSVISHANQRGTHAKKFLANYFPL